MDETTEAPEQDDVEDFDDEADEADEPEAGEPEGESDDGGEEDPAPEKGKADPVAARLRYERREARDEAKALATRLEQSERAQREQAQALQSLVERLGPSQPSGPAKPTEKPLPDSQEDPAGYVVAILDNLKAQVDEMQAERTQRLKASEQQQQVDKFKSAVMDDYKAFAATKPDFRAAAQFYTDDFIRRNPGLTTPEELEMAVVQRALAQNKRPAEYFYELALSADYTPQAEQDNADEVTEKLKKAEKARSLSGRGSSAGGMTQREAIRLFHGTPAQKSKVEHLFRRGEDGSPPKVRSLPA